jgi:hypothetical protein
LSYTEALPPGPVQRLEGDALEYLAHGEQPAAAQWVDLYGEGMPGLLVANAGAWAYLRNDGGGRLRPPETVSRRPALAAGRARPQLTDMVGDGRMRLVTWDEPVPGVQDREANGDWGPFRPFAKRPAVDPADPNLRFLDLDGDGRPDLLLTEHTAFRWHPSLGLEGYGPSETVAPPSDGPGGPSLVFDDGTETIFLADMSGDGLTDLVRVRAGEVAYWPNLGYGRFGARVRMAGAPSFEPPDRFDTRRLRLVDVDGSGTTDII